MEKSISVIIPNYNKASTIGKCLEAAFLSRYGKYEVIVVDDCSTDNSVEIIKTFPCTLLQLETHGGTSKARNTGALNSKGEILFFIDSDCLLQEDTLLIANKACTVHEGKKVIISGTYTKIPYDDNFFSAFQSVFINYFETKKNEPDYIPGHSVIIKSEYFKDSEGFSEDFLAMIEDVEFSHRMRRAGYKLLMSPQVLVQHVFNFNLVKSLKNAFRKSFYWTIYSIKNKDLFKDSGTASVELKINAASNLAFILSLSLYALFKNPLYLTLIPTIFAFNLFINRGLVSAFYRAKGTIFSLGATLYYTMVYPVPVLIGALTGMLKYPGSSSKI